MNDPTLKPCPFGCAGQVIANKNWEEWMQHLTGAVAPDGREDCPAKGWHSIAAWNRRSGEETPPAPICIGYETLGILAREGAVFNLVAADDLYGTTPVPGETPEMKAFVAAARACCSMLDRAVRPLTWWQEMLGFERLSPLEKDWMRDALARLETSWRALIESEGRRP